MARQLDAALGTSGLLHGGKWVNIPFLRKGIAKHHVVLLEAGGKCLGTAFWWKWLVTVLNLE